MAAPLLVPAAQSIPAPPPLIVVSMDSVDDGIIQEEESQTVNDALLPKTLNVVAVPATIVADGGCAASNSSSNNHHVARRWWDGWLRTDPPEAISDVMQQNGPKNHSKKRSKKKSSEVRVVNHQNNYVAVTLSENDPAHPAATADPCPSPTPSSQQPRRRICWWFLFLLLLLTVACLAFVAVSLVSLLRNGQGPLTTDATVCFTEECVRTAASLLLAMNQSADPCQDFFQFACGTWNKKHLIPEDRSSISTFEVLFDQLQIILKDLLQEKTIPEDNETTNKTKLFYNSCMNTSHIRSTGDTVLRETLQSLGGWPVLDVEWSTGQGADVGSVENLLGRLRGELNQGVMIEQWVGPDDKNSSVNIIQIDQMHLGLPARDYYLKPSSALHVKAYHRYMTEVAVLLGADKLYASDEMKKVLHFETLLAHISIPEADRHDTGAIYDQMTLVELEVRVPEIRWREYFNAFLPNLIVEDSEPIVSYAMSYFEELGKLLMRTERRIVQNYALWRLIMELVPHLSEDYLEKRAEFRRVLTGVLSERNRWNQCIDYTNKKLGMAVGAMFIRDNFNQESKEVALEMIHTLREAFIDTLDEIEWMDEETRQVAKEKALAMNERIGYPEMLTQPDLLAEEYASLNFTDGHFQNILNIKRYEAEYNLNKLRQPVFKDKWSTEPAVVNAFYNPNTNDIVFPAGILQPLFYSSQFPKSLNYGGIGVVIGHEITHGFDDKGRQFDKDGNLKQWWNNATVQAFRQRTQCIIDQYSNYILDDVGLYIDGRMTQGENIADNGGLKQAYRAYRKWVGRHGEEPLLPGLNLSHDQLFFLNYAQIWCGTMRPEDAISKIRSSVHSPGPIRVLGPLSNSPEFARAYQCPLGSPMNPYQKCSVW
ncbi:Endothelin-converting enzyme 1 [Daphnia magna]|uniref:Endothelin-converting enzyme 1 n=1 Tax=Daphnia magna TaxID=35525 RepID=A0A0P4ZJU5_9CRUS|nr:Endothelin-converting enzyme 1 [Daphnia magna]